MYSRLTGPSFTRMCRVSVRLVVAENFCYVVLVVALVGDLSIGLHRDVQQGNQIHLSRSLVASGWKMQSTNHIVDTTLNLSSKDKQWGISGSTISREGFDTSGWHTINKFPTTVLAGLQESDEYPNLYYSNNLQAVDPSQFDVSWWYRTEVQIPVPVSTRSTITLLFKGINYRANVWINGKQVADNKTMVGSFRQFSIDVDDAPDITDENGEDIIFFVLAVETFRPFDYGLDKNLSCRGRGLSDCLDLAISWVDWAPTPPDVNMGVWQDVQLAVTGPVSLQYPQVTTKLLSSLSTYSADQPPSAALSVLVEAAVHPTTTGAPIQAELRGQIDCPTHPGDGVAFNQTVLLHPAKRGPGASVVLTQLVFNSDTHSQLVLQRPALWWPHQMGNATLCHLRMSITCADSVSHGPVLREGGRKSGAGSDGALANMVVSDEINATFGIRQITKTIDANNNAVFRVNNKRILIRGGGWAPDLLQRMTRERHVQELMYVRHLGLNTIRLEGKFQNDDLFAAADALGILVLPGICCCDAWQQWPHWGPDQHSIASASVRDQAKRLRIYASIVGFLYSSDELPPPDVEKEFLKVFQEERWNNPIISSASYRESTLTGTSGVKMTGPYGWVPPNFWLDPRGQSHDYGGAFGFITETSPGGSPMVRESFEQTFSPQQRWGSVPGEETRAWDFHCGSEHGAFGSMEHFTPALAARLGTPTSYVDYLAKGQLEAYESHRAMFEGYSRNKYNATGIVQWMLNNGWPQMVWHLYDWYLAAGGAFYGVKKATEPIHIMYSPPDGSIWVINSQYEDTASIVRREFSTTTEPSMQASAQVYSLEGSLLKTYAARDVPVVPADGTLRLFAIDARATDPFPGTVLLRVQLSTAPTSTRHVADIDVRENIVSENVYWLPKHADTFPMAGCFTGCNVTTFANMSDLSTMPSCHVRVATQVHAGTTMEAETVHVTLENTGSAPVFFARIRVLKASDATDILPAYYSDNFITVFAGESRSVDISYAATDGSYGQTIVEPYNDCQVQKITL
eukprot:m.994917 g.994917  ORF g.994917 m.994917 type:complete len:1025 (+) comp24014_c1_seq5:15-3089(+)